MDSSKQSPIPTTKSLISSETRRKYEEKVCKYKYKLNKQINRSEELSNQLKKLEAAYEALKLEMDSKEKFVVRIMVYGDGDNPPTEHTFETYEDQHPAFKEFITNETRNGNRDIEIEMSNKEEDFQTMFLFKDGEGFHSFEENLVGNLIKTLEKETEWSDLGETYWPDGVHYTIKLDYSDVNG